MSLIVLTHMDGHKIYVNAHHIHFFLRIDTKEGVSWTQISYAPGLVIRPDSGDTYWEERYVNVKETPEEIYQLWHDVSPAEAPIARPRH